MASAARVFGWSEGQIWTVAIGLTLAFALAVSSIPAALRAIPAIANRTAAPAPMIPDQPGPAAASDAPDPQPPVPDPDHGSPPPAPELDDEPPFGRPSVAMPPSLAPGAVRSFSRLPADTGPGGLTVAGAGRVFGSTDAPGGDRAASTVLAWDAFGSVSEKLTVPGQPPDRARGITALDTGGDGTLVAVDAATQRVLRHKGAASWTPIATVPDVAPCLLAISPPCQPGAFDTTPLLRGLVVDQAGTAYVSDAGQGIIWRVRNGAPIEVWWSGAEAAGADGLAGLALDGHGHLLAVVTRRAAVPDDGMGALLRIARDATGAAGASSTVVTFPAGEEPVDVEVAASGSVYLALRGAQAVVGLDHAGVERLRITDGLLRRPTALALGPQRLYVTSSTPVGVLQVGTTDRPLR